MDHLDLNSELNDAQEKYSRTLEKFRKYLLALPPANNTEKFLLDIIRYQHQISEDIKVWPDKITLTQYANSYFIRNRLRSDGSILRLGAEGLDNYGKNIREAIFNFLKFSWGEGLGCLAGDIERGLPVYKKHGNGFINCNGDPDLKRFNSYFYGTIWDEQFAPTFEIDWSCFLNLYISQRESALFQAVVSNYEAPVNGIIWTAQIQAFNNLLKSEIGDSSGNHATSPPKEIGTKEKQNLLKTIGLLTTALAQKNSARYARNGEININAISSDLTNLLEDQEGLSDRSIRDRLTSGVELIASYLKSS